MTKKTKKMALSLSVLLLAGTLLTSCVEPRDQATFSPSPSNSVAAESPVPTCESLKVPQSFQDDVNSAARKSGLEPSVIAAIITVQSNWQEDAVSPVGSRGIALTSVEVWKEHGQGNILNGHDHIRTLGVYLKHLADTLKGRQGVGADYTDLVIAAHVAGETAVLNAGEVPAIPEVRTYVNKVKAYAEQIKSCAKDPS
ncbi:transglycosylase SLT domain-containing protein [Glutamicibacter arilaitensis]|uniref:transglycosylase SLT domain-containing protein n=1 Tax=Glutamicibacter TaxID=1742989 RepID=UPI003F8DE093